MKRQVIQVREVILGKLADGSLDTFALASRVYGRPESKLTAAQKQSVRRALRGLAALELIEPRERFLRRGWWRLTSRGEKVVKERGLDAVSALIISSRGVK
jgi:hypothetical protein